MPVPVVALKVDEPVVVPQTKPLDVTLAPPSDVIVPPLVALDPVIDAAAEVDETVGSMAIVVKFVSVP